MQPPARVEHVPERKQVRLVRAAAVMEDQQPVGLTRRPRARAFRAPSRGVRSYADLPPRGTFLLISLPRDTDGLRISQPALVARGGRPPRSLHTVSLPPAAASVIGGLASFLRGRLEAARAAERDTAATTVSPMANWEDVRRLALALPETTEDLSHGNLFWRVRDKGFVWERPLRKADLKALGDAAPSGPILGGAGGAPGRQGGAAGRRPGGLLYDPALRRLLGGAGATRPGRTEGLEEVVVEAWLALAPPRLAKEYLEANPPPS